MYLRFTRQGSWDWYLLKGKEGSKMGQKLSGDAPSTEPPDNSMGAFCSQDVPSEVPQAEIRGPL